MHLAPTVPKCMHLYLCLGLYSEFLCHHVSVCVEKVFQKNDMQVGYAMSEFIFQNT